LFLAQSGFFDFRHARGGEPPSAAIGTNLIDGYLSSRHSRAGGNPVSDGNTNLIDGHFLRGFAWC
jgi:hypothetical protein